MQEGLREGFYEITNPNVIAIKIDDKGWRGGYKNGGHSFDTVYIPDDVFVRCVKQLIGKPLNLNHRRDAIKNDIGKIVDVIQNTNGIKGNKQILRAEGENLGAYFAIAELNGVISAEEASNYKGSSTEFNILRKKDNYKVNGGIVDVLIEDYALTGLALTPTPRALEADVILNSYEEKKLDNENNNINTQLSNNFNMAEITPEIKKEIENAIKNAMEDIQNKVKNTQDEELKNKIKNGIDEYEKEKLKNAEDEKLKNAEMQEKEELKNAVKNMAEEIKNLKNSIKNEEPEKKEDENGKPVENSLYNNPSQDLLRDRKLTQKPIHNSDVSISEYAKGFAAHLINQRKK